MCSDSELHSIHDKPDFPMAMDVNLESDGWIWHNLPRFEIHRRMRS